MDKVQRNAVVVGMHAQAMIGSEARKRVALGQLRSQEVEDARQYVAKRLCKALGRYDPSRGAIEAMVTVTVITSFSMYIREKRALKRASGERASSLDDRGPDGSSPPKRDSLSLVDHARRLGLGSDGDPLDEIALGEATATLEPDLGEALRLAYEHGEVRAAQHLGIARRQVRKRVALALQHFRKHFGDEE